MVLRESCQVVVPATMNADEGDPAGAELLELNAVADRYQPVAGAMNDVNGAGHLPDPLVGA